MGQGCVVGLLLASGVATTDSLEGMEALGSPRRLNMAEAAPTDGASGTILTCLLNAPQPEFASSVAVHKERSWHILRSAGTANGKVHKKLLGPDIHARKAAVGSQYSPTFSPTTSPTLSGSSGEGSDEEYLFADFELDGLEELDITPAQLEFEATLQLEPLVGKGGAQLKMTEDSAQLVVDVYDGLISGGSITSISADSVSGTYVVRDQGGESLAIFKPCDEEAGTNEGDMASLSTSVQRGCAPGEGAKREYLAYMLDQQSPEGFRAGVPATALVRLRHPTMFGGMPKEGSLMRFVNNRGGAEDFGPSCFSEDNVHRLALFDLRTLNLDRHGGNILVDSATGDLVPIDHGCAFPTELGEPWLDWRLWRQAETELSSETRSFIQSLDPLAVASLSDELGLPDGVWRTVAVMTLLIQACLGGGKMTLRQVAELTMNRWSDTTSDAEVSFVEKLGTDLVAADRAAKAVESEEWPWPGNAGQSTFVERCRLAIEGRRQIAVD